MNGNAKNMSIQEFLDTDVRDDVNALIGKYNTGSFMQCHTAIFAETGIWVDELVPVFQKFDATLAASTERKVRRLAPDAFRD